MARFKVLSQRELERLNDVTSSFTLVVAPIAGEIVQGLEFIGYCTHHPFTVVVRSVEKDGALLLLKCETTWPVYEGHFEEAVIDTAGADRKARFFYDHEKRYGI